MEPSDSLNVSQVIMSGEPQKSYLGLTPSFTACSASLMRVKVEGGNVADGSDGSDCITPKPSRSSYIQQSEHVVIPTDPSLMQGIIILMGF